MKLNDNPILILLAIILVGLGVEKFFGPRIYPFPGNQILTYAMFILAAVVLFVVLAGRVRTGVGLVIMALWLLLIGLLSWLNVTFPYSDIVLAVLPIGAGIFMLLGL